MLYGLITLLLMLVFIGIVAWAWSSRRKQTYEKAARMPLEEDRQASSRLEPLSHGGGTKANEKEPRP